MPSRLEIRQWTRRSFLRGLTGQTTPTEDRREERVHDAITYDTPVVTHAGSFFTQIHRRADGPPLVDLAAWTLSLGGLVERPLDLSYDALRALPAVGEMRTLLCLGNPAGGESIGNAVWRGVSLDVLLAQVGVLPAATRVRVDAADGYHTSLPLERVVSRGVLLAYEMNGARLPREHGFPLRAVVPGLYGTKSPKWLTGITLIDHDHLGTWEREPYGWSDAAIIKTRAQIMSPLTYSEVQVGNPIPLQGVAFAGDRRITAVEVSVDGGGWMPVTLRPPDSPHAWTQWYTLWTPSMTGETTVAVRASDDSGFAQSRRAGHLPAVYPDGSDAIHQVVLRVV